MEISLKFNRLKRILIARALAPFACDGSQHLRIRAMKNEDDGSTLRSGLRAEKAARLGLRIAVGAIMNPQRH